MAYKNGRQYSSIKGINLLSENGVIRFEAPSTEPTTTAGEYVLYVNSSNQLIFDDGSSSHIASLGGKIIFSAIETIAAGGTTTALDLTKSLHSVDADAGGDIFTLADGTIGQVMTITMVSATGVATITPANLAGGTSITFNAAGDSVVLQFVDTNWYILGGNSYAIV